MGEAPDLRVLVLAPVGRSALLACEALTESGLSCVACETMDELCRAIDEGAGAVLLLEEALARQADACSLALTLESQPAWSDLPVTVLVENAEAERAAFTAFRKQVPERTMLVLERPMRRAALVSAMETSLRHRERQYRVRDLIAELRDARRTAEEANRTKSEFLGVMSHELRTPLNAIIGFGELLESGVSGALTERQRLNVERIGKSAAHLRGLIEELLAFSRLEAGKEKVNLQRVDAATLVRDSVDLVERSARERGLELRLRVPDAPFELDTDARKLRQILLNLLGNAIKFTESGSVEIEVDAADGAWVHFHVRDSGRGIAERDQARIFEPFEQVDASLTRRSEGTGLGLGVSRKLAHLLGGELSVESRIGDGSTFTLRIPRRLRDAAAADPEPTGT